MLHSMCIMHTCIAFSSCIILTPCFIAIIDSSGSSCVWERRSSRLVRIDSSPKSIAKEILCKLDKSFINLLCLEAAPTPVKQTRKMDQQEGKWFMNNLRAMIQDELKQALAGLIPLPAVETTLISDIV